MTVRGKQELRNIFVTGAIPTQQNFTDFIDSYIASINGNIPDVDGNIRVAVPFNVTQNLTPMQLPRTYEIGRTIGVYDYKRGIDSAVDDLLNQFNLPDGRFTIITDNFDSSGIVIQQIDTFKNGAFVPSLTRTSLEGQNVWGPLVYINNVTSINGKTPDVNGNVIIEDKAASVFYRSASNQTVLLDNTTMIFNGKDNNNISVTVNPENGVFTLDPTKKYSFQVNPVIQFVSGATNVDYSMFSFSEGAFTQITSQRGFISNDGSTGSGSAQSGYFVVNGATHPQVAIRAITIGGSSETRGFGLLNIYSHVLVQEL